MIDKRKLRTAVLMSWIFTLMGIFNLVILCVIVSLLFMRFSGPEGFMAVFMPTVAFSFVVMLMGEVVVNMMYRARSPDPDKDRRVVAAVRNVAARARMWVCPRIWIISLGGMPNAMAYGLPLPGCAAIGASRELVDLMSDEELEAVIAHEMAHIRCRDTGILVLINLILGMIQKLRAVLTEGWSVWTTSPIVVAIGWMIYSIGYVALAISRFSISQERETAADLLGACYMGTPEPLISGLKKLEGWIKEDEKSLTKNGAVLKDLMAAHPGLEERIRALEAITIKP